MKIIKRSGAEVDYDITKIIAAVQKANESVPVSERMTKEQMRFAVGLLLFTHCILKSVLPFRLEKDALGYDFLWYLCVFLVAAYIRRFGWDFLQKKRNCTVLCRHRKGHSRFQQV